MADEFRHKIIIDPVHGDIGLSKLETEIIDTPTFQRLKGIKQLGFAHTVYPNARHTRFEHSLGVMYIMNRILRSCEGLADLEHVQRLRVAALLHDIGHYPYSHLMEKIDWDSARKYIKKKGQKEDKAESIHKPYPKHERLGEIIVTERKDIKETLEQHDIDPKDIAALIKGEHQHILPNLLSASLDVDRLDYLLRDALNTGLPYGHVDINYIVNNLELTDEKEIVVRAKARNSVEHMLIARYFMFNTLYMHKTVFAFEEVVRKIVLLLWEENEIYTSGDDVESMARGDSGAFLDFHDGYLDKLIHKYADKDDDHILTILCKAVKLRKAPKLVCEVAELKRNDDHPSPRYTIMAGSWGTKVKDFSKEFGISEDLWIFKRNIKVPKFEKMHPFLSLAEARAFPENEVSELVKIKERSGTIIHLLEDKRSILYYLSRLEPMFCRVYVVGIDRQKADEIGARIEEWLQPQLSD